MQEVNWLHGLLNPDMLQNDLERFSLFHLDRNIYKDTSKVLTQNLMSVLTC